jgi:membrane protease YdiL (CAAX protease family)
MEPANTNYIEEVEPIVETQEPLEDNKWFGVPPVGQRPLPPKEIYVLMVLGIIALEIGIWAVYRAISAPLFAGYGTMFFFLIHIIAAPMIHLIPIILFWKFFRRERGLPFTFTKKLIMSGVIVGFVLAIIWRFLEEVSYDVFAGAAGGTVPGTFTFFNLMDANTITILALMTFVHFFIVGPVEELEFRSFAQDQAARVIPNWQALIFSSVLFGCSHIPIAVFVYQFPPHIFVVAFLGWISAGFVFGVLYIYSRNILACIVMHGMGNWQLSIFYFQSTQIIGGMDSFTTVAVGTASSILADAIIILLILFIHKYYWQPHRKGEPALGGVFLKIQNFIHDHDFNDKPLKSTGPVLVAFIVVIMMLCVGITAAFGETDRSKFSTFSQEDSGGSNLDDLDSYLESPENVTGGGYLDEGTSTSETISSELDEYIKEVKVTLTWTDEPDTRYFLRTYENEPDTFSVSINAPNASVSKSASNVHGEQGMVETELSFSIEEIAEIISEEVSNYTFTVEITMVEAGDSFTTGAVGFTDFGNDYEYEMEIIRLVPEE